MAKRDIKLSKKYNGEEYGVYSSSSNKKDAEKYIKKYLKPNGLRYRTVKKEGRSKHKYAVYVNQSDIKNRSNKINKRSK